MKTKQNIAAVEEDQPRPAVKTKWGDAVTGGRNGYQILPDALLRNQRRLGLTCTEMMVLINVLMHWWETAPTRMPHPRPEQIARRMDASTRTVQRALERLCELGLLASMKSERLPGGPTIRRYDVSGLKKKLREFANEVEGLEAA
jgi:predicted transcriptional regulator